jgi:threonylcarbamoyladenosine tRNA methylthiotransferase MtaB
LAGTQALPAINSFDGHQRAFVKVQDGCDAFCSYCVAPYTRWRVWSRSINEVEDECRKLLGAGHKEVVLSGVFLGAFGRRTAIRGRWGGTPSKLPELVRRIASLEGLWRVRLSSLEPADMTQELLAVCRDTPRVAPPFHLPLQSGSAAVLGRMNRQYSPEQYVRTVDAIREAFDCPAITTDIIAGFPGESDAGFAEALAVARHCGFAKIHAFPFSLVAVTSAWAFRHQAPPRDVVKRRMAELAELETELAAAYRRKLVGRTLEALVENAAPGHPDERQAMTDRYRTVFFEANVKTQGGDIVRLEVTGLCRAGLTGGLAQA